MDLVLAELCGMGDEPAGSIESEPAMAGSGTVQLADASYGQPQLVCVRPAPAASPQRLEIHR